MIAAIAEKKKKFSNRSDDSDLNYGNHFAAIVAIAATTIAEIELFLSHDRWKVISIMIAMIAELFFSLSDRSDSSDHMETRPKIVCAS